VLSLNVTANEGALEREATFLVKNDKHSFNVSVTQATGGYVHKMNPTSLTFIAEGETKTSTITANGNSSYTIESKPDWATASLTGNNTTSAIITVTTSANEAVKGRTGQVKMKANDGSELVLSLVQFGVEGETSISTTSVTLNKDMNSFATVQLSANYNCEWKLDDENLPE
jgi:hypothetical protein